MKLFVLRLALIGCGITLFIAGCDSGDGDGKERDSTTTGEPDAGQDGGDTAAEEVDTEILIEGVMEILPLEDFDDGDIENALGGTWLAYDDGFDNGDSRVWPKTVFEDGVFESSAPGFGGGLAAHVTGTTGGVLGWDYLGFLTSLHKDALCPKATPTEVDLAEYDGIQFMAKGTITTGAMIFKIPHKMDGEEGNCVTNPVAAESLTAYCDYEIDFKDKLKEEWTLIRIRFDGLAQPSWGDAVDLSEVLAHAKEFVWQYTAQDGALDFWLDNVALFKDEPGPDDIYPRPAVESTDSLTLYDDPADPSVGTVTDMDVSEEASFEVAKSVEIDAQPEMMWNVMLSAANETVIKRDDLLHVRFSAKCVSPPEGESECRTNFLFQKADAPYTRSVMVPVTVGDEWAAFSYPFLSAEAYDPGEALAMFFLGFPAETIAIGDFSITNFGDTEEIENLSKTDISYNGRESDAKWREAAADRIETYRKGDLTILVTNGDGEPVPDAEIALSMTNHYFGFGTAVNADDLKNGLSGTDLDNYEAAIPELFNTVVFENTLKWPALAGDWGDTLGLSLAEWGLDWTEARELQTRGHALVWPGWNNLPSALKTQYDAEAEDNGEDAAAAWLKAEVEDHIRETADPLAGRLFHWDVLNEPFDNHDLMDILGEEVIADWFRLAREADPDAKLFINDYSVMNRKTTYSASRDNLRRIVSDLVDADAPIDGIGLQSHFEADLTAPEEVYAILEQLAVFDKELWITEFDMPDLDPTLAADYTRDFLTMVFSHPMAAGFVMWGFWDGNHFGESAPIYNTDWTEKPSGEVYRDLVFNEWWTEDSGTTDSDGQFTTRGFFGDYTVTITVDGEPLTETFSFPPGSSSVEIAF